MNVIPASVFDHKLFGDNASQGLNLVDPARSYLAFNTSLRCSEKHPRHYIHKYSIYDYKPPLFELYNATLIYAKYALVKNFFFIDGMTYHRHQIECPVTDELQPATAENVNHVFQTSSDYEFEDIEEAVLIGGNGNFGHFVFENMPKAFRFTTTNNSDAIILVDESVPERFYSFFRLIGLGNKVKKIKKSINYRVRKLTIIGCCAHRHPQDSRVSCDIETFKYMRAHILSSVRDIQTKERDIKHYFVTRRGEKWRRLDNLSQVEDVLKKEISYYEFFPHKLEIPDQIKLAFNADLGIQVAGGSSPLSIFAKKGSTQVEIIAPGQIGDWGVMVWCAIFGIYYIRIEGEYKETSVNYGNNEIDRDFYLDPKLMKLAVYGF